MPDSTETPTAIERIYSRWAQLRIARQSDTARQELFENVSAHWSEIVTSEIHDSLTIHYPETLHGRFESDIFFSEFQDAVSAKITSLSEMWGNQFPTEESGPQQATPSDFSSIERRVLSSLAVSPGIIPVTTGRSSRHLGLGVQALSRVPRNNPIGRINPTGEIELLPPIRDPATVAVPPNVWAQFNHFADLFNGMRVENPYLPPPVVREPDLIESEDWEIVARTTTTRSSRAVKKNADPIYTWGLQSSKPRNGGQYITYEVRMEENGELRCNCPGWVFKKSGETRACKHTRTVLDEAKDFYKRHKRGEALPTTIPSEQQMERLKSNTKTESKIGTFGRIVDFE